MTTPDDVFNADWAKLEFRMLAYLESGEQAPPGVYEGTITDVKDFELSNGKIVCVLTMRVKDGPMPHGR